MGGTAIEGAFCPGHWLLIAGLLGGCGKETRFEPLLPPASVAYVAAITVRPDGALGAATALGPPEGPVRLEVTADDELQIVGYSEAQLSPFLADSSLEERAAQLSLPASCRVRFPEPVWRQVPGKELPDARPLPPLGLSSLPVRCPLAADFEAQPRVDWGCGASCPQVALDQQHCRIPASEECGLPATIGVEVLSGGNVCVDAPTSVCAFTGSSTEVLLSCPSLDCYPSIYAATASTAGLASLTTVAVGPAPYPPPHDDSPDVRFASGVSDLWVEDDRTIALSARRDVDECRTTDESARVVTFDRELKLLGTEASVPCLFALARGAQEGWAGLSSHDGTVYFEQLGAAFGRAAPAVALGRRGVTGWLAGLAKLPGQERWLAAWEVFAGKPRDGSVALAWVGQQALVATATITDAQSMELEGALFDEEVAVISGKSLSTLAISSLSLATGDRLQRADVPLAQFLGLARPNAIGARLGDGRWLLLGDGPGLAIVHQASTEPSPLINEARNIFAGKDGSAVATAAVLDARVPDRLWVAFATYAPEARTWSSHLGFVRLARFVRPGLPGSSDYRMGPLWIALSPGEGPVSRLRVSPNGQRICGLLPWAGKVFCAKIVPPLLGS